MAAAPVTNPRRTRTGCTTDLYLGRSGTLLDRRSLSPPAGPNDSQPEGQTLLGPHDGLGNPEESGLQGAGSIRQDARGSASSPFTTFTREKDAIPPSRRRLRHGRDRPHCHRGSRPSRREPVRGRGRTTPGESATLPHASSGRLLFAARLAGLRDVWLCLLRQARQPSLAERPDARLRLLPLCGDRCVSVRWSAGVQQRTGPHGSVGQSRVGRCLRPAGGSGASASRARASASE